jgi:hypothetical protein
MVGLRVLRLHPSPARAHLTPVQPITASSIRRQISAARWLLAAFAVTLVCGYSYAQQVAATDIPNAPKPQQSAAATSATQPDVNSDPQTKRILGIFPNFRAVTSDTHLPPQSVKEKFVTASQDSFDYSSFVLPALLAGYGEADNKTPEFHHGAAGYGRYYWHSFVDQTDENYWVEFIVPALTREDTRYYTLGPGGGGTIKRIGYALSRAVVTRNDKGHDTFNASEVVGAGAAAGISNLYYPRPERTVSNTTDQWVTNVGIDAASFVIREFWPDINHHLLRGKQPAATH